MTVPALQLEHVSKVIGGLTILEDISLTVQPGERRAIIGPNGAGKTTLLNVIAGFLPATRGRVLVFGRDITKLPAHRRVDVGLLKTNQQPAVFHELTTRQNILMALLRGRHRLLGLGGLVDRDYEIQRQAERVLEEWGLLDVSDVEVRHLPHGYQRRVELAARFALRPKLLLLDEPAAGLAVDEIPAFIERLRQLPRDMTVVLVEHSMRVVFSFADRITVLHHGAVLADGTPNEIQQNEDVQAAYLAGAMRGAMLELRDVYGGYGEGFVLNGLSLTVEEGQVVGLLGRNGAGKTSTMRAIMGLLPRLAGDIRLRGESLVGLPPHVVASKGLALVPQGRRIFPSLTVTENLLLGARPPRPDQPVRWTVDDIYQLFPILKERGKIRGTLLSGGEQQMLTIARSLMTQPLVLLCDEPSEGLAPVMVQRVGEILQRLKQAGLSILLAEQNLDLALSVVDVAYIIEEGQVIWHGSAQELLANRDLQETYLGLRVEV